MVFILQGSCGVIVTESAPCSPGACPQVAHGSANPITVWRIDQNPTATIGRAAKSTSRSVITRSLRTSLHLPLLELYLLPANRARYAVTAILQVRVDRWSWLKSGVWGK